MRNRKPPHANPTTDMAIESSMGAGFIAATCHGLNEPWGGTRRVLRAVLTRLRKGSGWSQGGCSFSYPPGVQVENHGQCGPVS